MHSKKLLCVLLLKVLMFSLPGAKFTCQGFVRECQNPRQILKFLEITSEDSNRAAFTSLSSPSSVVYEVLLSSLRRQICLIPVSCLEHVGATSKETSWSRSYKILTTKAKWATCRFFYRIHFGQCAKELLNLDPPSTFHFRTTQKVRLSK